MGSLSAFGHLGGKDAIKGRIVILSNDIQCQIFQCGSLWDSRFSLFLLLMYHIKYERYFS